MKLLLAYKRFQRKYIKPLTRASQLDLRKFLKNHPKHLTYALLGSIILLAFSFIVLPIITNFLSGLPPRLVKSKDYLYRAENKYYQVGIGNNANQPVVNFSTSDNTSISFTMRRINDNPSPPVRKGRKLTFENVLDNVDLTYETLAQGVKEEIILNAPIDNNTFNFLLTTQNADALQVINDFYQPVFYDTDGNYLFHFQKGFAYDANGDRTDDVTIQIHRSEYTGQLHAQISVEPGWFFSPERSYPIHIDPTVVHDTSAEFSGIKNRISDTGSGSNPNLISSFHELPADSHTVGLWHMNETADNSCSGGEDACDSSSYGGHGTATGTTIETTNQKLGAAARSFNGSSDYILVTNAGPINFTQDEPFTVEAWVMTNTTAAQAVLNKQENVTSEFTTSLGVSSDNTPYFAVGKQNVLANPSATSADPLNTGTWYHLAGVSDGQKIYLYVNGDLVDTKDIIISGSTRNIANAQIGRNYNSTSYWNGLIDEFRFSNTARSPEEIKEDANRLPYSIYISPTIDLGATLTTIDSLAWTELGVATGNGETPKDTTSLLARWDLNETSGTTANNGASASCGTDCDLTLTNFSDTSGQDAGYQSGWTANNARWGAGALMFNGSNDDASTSGSITATTAITYEAWINYSSAATINPIIHWGPTVFQQDGSLIYINTDHKLYFRNTEGNKVNDFINRGEKVLEPGRWYHVAVTQSQPNLAPTFYVDGTLVPTTNVNQKYPTSRPNGPIHLGYSNLSGSDSYFQGTMDAVRIYSRVLSAAEVASDSQVHNIEFMTRTSTDSASWEAWKPFSNESTIDSLDNPLDWATPSASTFTTLPLSTSSASFPKVEGSGSLRVNTGQLQVESDTIALWHLDETGGTGAYLKDSSSNGNHGTPTGTTITNGLATKGRSFNGSSDTVNAGTSASFGSLEYNTPMTFEAWIKTNTDQSKTIFSKQDTSANTRGYNFQLGTGGFLFFQLSNVYPSNALEVRSTNNLNYSDNRWHHVAATYDGSTSASGVTIYYDGVKIATTTTINALSATISNTASFHIGSRNGTTQFLNGSLDEVRVSNTQHSASQIAESYHLGRNHYLTKSFSSTDLTTANKLPFYVAADRPGSYLEASIGESLLSNNLPGANFRGFWHLDDDVLGDIELIDFTSTNVTAANAYTYQKTLSDSSTVATGDILEYDVFTENNVAGVGGIDVRFTDATYARASGWVDQNGLGCHPGTNISAYTYQKWYHRKCIIPAGLNGKVISWIDLVNEYDTNTAITTRYDNFRLMSGTTVKSNIYTSGALPFNVFDIRSNASNVANSAASNYLAAASPPSLNTLLGPYLKDGSDNNNLLTATGSASIPGKLGQAREFDGGESYLYCTDGACGGTSKLDFGASASFSYGAWVKTTNPSSANMSIITKKNSISDTSAGYSLIMNSGNYFTCRIADGTNFNIASTNPITSNDDKWHQVTCTSDGSNLKIYLDGILRASSSLASVTSSLDNTEDFRIGATGNDANFFNGSIDEAFVTAETLTASNINQLATLESRTHPITIDFAASLDSGDLITGSGDTGFTVDATTFGFAQKGTGLYQNDKIIVKENYDGTEYIAQGVVSSITQSTGAVTVSSWDASSTFPSGGFTINASVFKWQREYFDISPILDSHLDGTANITMRLTDGSEGRTVWLDDLRSNGTYLTNSAGSSVPSTADRYLQYMAILSTVEESSSSAFNSVTVSYTYDQPPNQVTLDNSYIHDNARVPTLTPEIRFTTTDPEGGDIVYQIEWGTDSSFPSSTTKQSDTDAGFANVTTPADTSPFNSGDTISYTFQTNLSDSTTYFYHVRGYDPGIGEYGTWSNIKSFTTNSTQGLNSWYQTHADQFSTNTNTSGIVISDIGNSVTATNSNEFSTLMNITVNNSGGTLTNYDLLLQIDTATPIGLGKMQADCDDVRFRDASLTDYSFWLEQGCNTDATQYWVRIPSLPTGDTVIKLYYGSTTATYGGQVFSGNFIVMANASCPAGWTADTDMNNNNYFPRGAATYGTTGGATNYQHTWGFYSGYSGNSFANTGSNPRGDHRHYLSGTTTGGSVLPLYLNFVFCDQTGKVSDKLPTSIFGMYESLPSGWTQLGGYDTRYPRANGTAGATGGASTHNHTASAYSGGATNNSHTGVGDGGPTSSAGVGHTHFYNVTTGNGNNLPVYLDMIYASPSASATISSGMITAFDSAPPYGWTRYSALDGYFPRINATQGGTGGSNTHNHSMSGNTTGSTNYGVYASPGGGYAHRDATHTHSISGSTTTVSSLPPYKELLYYQKNTQNAALSISNTAAVTTTSSATMTSTAIVASELAPGQGSWAKFLFSDDETAGDIKYHILYDNGGTPTLIPDGDLAGNSTGFDVSPVSLTGLTTAAYPTLYVQAVFTHSGVSPTLYDWEVILNTKPNTPTLNTPTTGSIGVSETPTLTTTGTDPDSDYLRYKITLCENSSMTLNCQTFDQTVSQTGWSGQDTESSTAYTSGTAASYTIQTPLTKGVIYYWKSQAIDPNGTNSWSNTQASPYNFTVNRPPDTPTLDSPANGSSNISTTPILKTTSIDQDGDWIRYKIQICTDVDMTLDCVLYDQTVSQTGWSGQDTQSTTAYTSGTQGVYGVQVPLAENTTYYWRSYAIDPNGTNTWSTTQAPPNSFTTTLIIEAPTQCTAEVATDNSSITINWSDNTPDETGFEVQRSINAGAFSTLDTTLPDVTSYLDATVSAGSTYQYRVRAKISAAGSDWCTTAFLNLGSASFRFEGLKMEGVQLH